MLLFSPHTEYNLSQTFGVQIMSFQTQVNSDRKSFQPNSQKVCITTATATLKSALTGDTHTAPQLLERKFHIETPKSVKSQRGSNSKQKADSSDVIAGVGRIDRCALSLNLYHPSEMYLVMADDRDSVKFQQVLAVLEHDRLAMVS